MSTNLNPTSHCPSCGKLMPVGALAGLCPACLLAQGVETEPAETKARVRFEPPKLVEISRLFPQLQVLELLGAGGMGAVYKARQPALDRFVALKVLPAGGGVGSTERFNREARALARLSHPNIVGVHEFGQVEGLHFFIMEFVDGANLRQLEKTSRLSAREALQIIPQICDALQYAHDEGVVHRDIKPENVLVDRKGRVKIADFGLAKIADPDPAAARLTVEGQVMGTPHYMAPEQVERPLAVDHRADIYALGVVFYEMLTGDLPLGKFAPPSRKVQLDVRLDDIVLRALENDPERRYQQASEVKQSVATVVDSPTEASSVRDEAASPAERHVRWLGIPVAVERNRVREVNFQGAMAATFVVMMCAAAAHMFVRWAAGREHALSAWVVLAGVVTLVGGIRQAMNQPGGDDQGVVGRQVARDALWLVGMVVFIIGSHYGMVNWIDARRASRDGAVAQLAKAVPASGTLAVTLANGTTIELLGLASGDSAPDQWWRPDGTRLAASVFDIKGPGEVQGSVRARTKFAFRLTGDTRAMETASHEFEPSAGMSAGGEVWQNGEQLAGGWPMVVGWAYVTNQATLRFGLRFDTWRNVAVFMPSKPSRTETSTTSGDPKWVANLNHYSDDGRNTQVTAVVNRESKQWQMRLVAVDVDGQEHVYQRANVTPAETTETWTCTFPNLTVDRIEKFQVQVQPVHWVEFRNVPLQPRGPAVVVASEIASTIAFGPPLLLRLHDVVDLDTGHTSKFPPAQPGGHPFADVAENVLWAQDLGFDAAAGIGELHVLGVTWAEINEAEWETMTPPLAEARLATSGKRPRTLTPRNPDRGSNPAFAFRTSEGNVGLIRFVELGLDSQEFTVQLRHARHADGGPKLARAKLDRRTGELFAGLPGSGFIALVGLKTGEAGADAWHRTDGPPKPDFAFPVADSPSLEFGEGRPLDLLFRVAGFPEPFGEPVFEFPGDRRHAVGGAVTTNQANDGSLLPVRVIWPESSPPPSLRVGVPIAGWHTIRSFEPISRSFVKTSINNDPKWAIEMHAAGVGTKGAQITVVFGTNHTGWNLRVLATRSRATDVLGIADAVVTNGPAVTRTYVFPEVARLEDIQNFQVQAQPLEWVEFANFALPPGAPVPETRSLICNVSDVAFWQEGRRFMVRVDYDTSARDDLEIFARSERLSEPALAEFEELVSGRTVKRQRRVWQLELDPFPGQSAAVLAPDYRTTAQWEALRERVAAAWLDRPVTLIVGEEKVLFTVPLADGKQGRVTLAARERTTVNP